MGDSSNEIKIILTRARDLLLSESQQAGSQGDWGRAKTLMELAERADRLCEELPGRGLGGAPGAKKEVPRASPPPEVEAPTQQPPGKENYPKYQVRDGVLVKQGLQRNGYDVYEHAVPRERYDQIIDRLVKVLPVPRPKHSPSFGIEEIQRKLDCPRYMTYVVVSLLLREKLLVRARKGRYTFVAPGSFGGDAATLWDRLKGENHS